MNKITTALLGLSTLLGISGCGAKQSNSQQTMNEDDGYTFVATLFCSTDGPNSSPAHYYLKNPDGTLYLDIHNEENDLTPDTLLDGKIFVYYWNVVSYAFFCKRPEAGKPIEVRVGDEWKSLESSAHIQIDSAGKFLQQYAYVPRGEEEWAKVSKASEVNPIYWIHWREGSKILIYPNEFVHKYSV